MKRQPAFDTRGVFTANERMLVAGVTVQIGDALDRKTISDRTLGFLYDSYRVSMSVPAEAEPADAGTGEPGVPIDPPVASGPAALPAGWRDMEFPLLKALAESLTGTTVKSRKAAMECLEGYDRALAA